MLRDLQGSPRCLENSSSENINCALREVDELLERWDNSISIDNLALAERYRKGELKVGVLFSTIARHVDPITVGSNFERRGSVLDFHEYIAVFERIPFVQSRSERRHLWWNAISGDDFGVGVEFGRREFHSNDSAACADRDQGAVLINDVQLVDLPECVCPSLVRFQPLGDPDGVRRGASEVSQTQIIKRLLGGTYWEISVSQHVIAGSAVLDSERSGEVVERCAEIVDNVAHDTAPFDRNRDRVMEAEDYVSRIRLSIGDDFVGVAPMVEADCLFKVSEVMFGPVDLYPGIQ